MEDGDNGIVKECASDSVKPVEDGDSEIVKDTTSDHVNVEELLNDGKNRLNVQCQRCNCVILKPESAVHMVKEMFLPFMHKKSENQNPEDGETLNSYWMVDNMFTFENVGFSNTVGTIKYLICADCEIGPIGWHDITNNKAFYVAIDRVKHVS